MLNLKFILPRRKEKHKHMFIINGDRRKSRKKERKRQKLERRKWGKKFNTNVTF